MTFLFNFIRTSHQLRTLTPHHKYTISLANMAGGGPSVYSLEKPVKVDEILKQEQRDADCTSCRLVGKKPRLFISNAHFADLVC